MKYLIDFHHDVTEAQIDAYLEQYGYTFLKEWDNFDKVVLVESEVEPVKTDIVEWVLNDETLEIRPQFEQQIEFNKHHTSLVVPNLPEITISTTDEKDWWKNYVLPQPNFDDPTVTISRKGQNVSVYILDSGFNKNTPEFDNVDVTNLFTITENDFSDQVGHGTSIASVISGNTCGITSAKLKIVKIFRTDRGTLQSEFLSALDAIINDCPNNTFAVANCSWSIPRNLWIESKLQQMMFKGIFVTAAAGNNGTPISDVTPAAMQDAFTIGSYNSDLFPSKFSDYSAGSIISFTPNDVNHGELDGWSPGEKIWCNGIDNVYGYSAGTSMACATASAVLAYNLTDFLDSTGFRISGYENMACIGDSRMFVNGFIFKRLNLLDLSDPKYANSRNVISTLLDGTNREVLLADVSVIAYADKGKQFVTNLFNPILTKESFLLSELPANVWINPDGVLWANPVQSQANDAVTGENFSRNEIKIKIITDQNEEIIITKILYIVPQEFTKDDLPPDHEIVVTLQSNCTNGGTNFECFFSSTSPNCTANCPFPNLCCGVTYGPKQDGCYCSSAQ